MIVAGFCFSLPNGLCNMPVLTCAALESVLLTVWTNTSILLSFDKPALLHSPWKKEPHHFTHYRGRKMHCAEPKKKSGDNNRQVPVHVYIYFSVGKYSLLLYLYKALQLVLGYLTSFYLLLANSSDDIFAH